MGVTPVDYLYLLSCLQQINIDASFVLQGKESENISLVAVTDTDLCEPAAPRDCTTVALYIKAELEFISKPVYLLTLEVEVRNNDFSFTRKVTNSYIFKIVF